MTRKLIWGTVLAAMALLGFSLWIPWFGESVSKLQTLSAAILAGGAAATAYEAAMAKVEQDRKNTKREVYSKTLGLALRLQDAVAYMAFEAGKRTPNINFEHPDNEGKDHIVIDTRFHSFPVPDVIREAWATVDLMPVEAVQPLSVLERVRILGGGKASLHSAGDGYQIYRGQPESPPLRHFVDLCDSIIEACEALSESLASQIEKLRANHPAL